MPDQPTDVTLDEIRERVRLSGLPIPEARFGLVRSFLVDALRPLRKLDSRAVRTLEPAVTFDAAAEERRHGR
jgi:hypothetical protein